MLDAYIIKKILEKLKEQSKPMQPQIPTRDYREYYKKKKKPSKEEERGIVIIDMR